jgi:hypothetical protein
MIGSPPPPQYGSMRNSLLHNQQYMGGSLGGGLNGQQASNYASNGVMGAAHNMGAFTGIGGGASGNISLGGAHNSESLKAHAF